MVFVFNTRNRKMPLHTYDEKKVNPITHVLLAPISEESYVPAFGGNNRANYHLKFKLLISIWVVFMSY